MEETYWAKMVLNIVSFSNASIPIVCSSIHSVKSQAAQHGFAIETDKAGKSIVKSMAEAEDATRKVGEQASQAGDKMAGMSAQAWDAGKDLVEQARRHNAALGAIQTSWLDAAAAASKYAEEAARLVFDSRKNIQAMRQEHAALVEQLEEKLQN